MADLLLYAAAVLIVAALLALRLDRECGPVRARVVGTVTVDFAIDTTRIDAAFAAFRPHSDTCTAANRAEGWFPPDCEKCEALLTLEQLRVTHPTTTDIVEARDAPIVRAVRERQAQYEASMRALHQEMIASAWSMAEFGRAWETTREHLVAVRSVGIHITHPQVWFVGDHDAEPLEATDLTPYIAPATWDAAAFDTHPTTPPPGDIAYGHIPDGCWRTISRHDGLYAACDAPADDDLVLCDRHRAELAQEDDA